MCCAWPPVHREEARNQDRRREMRVARVKRKSIPKATLIQISRLLARDLAMGKVTGGFM